MCPHCLSMEKISKRGFYRRQTGPKRRIQRYRCGACARFFGDATGTLTYRERKPHIDREIFKWVNSGVSQRRLARNLGVTPVTIARKIVRLGAFSARQIDRGLTSREKATKFQFDEMETFEHTKCKPLSIAIAVEKDTREIFAVRVASMPAKGRLAAISRHRYGHRKDGRQRALRFVLGRVRRVASPEALVMSDECPRYPGLVRSILPLALHLTVKGRRARGQGLGELKKGHDPIFSLNHSCAMNRDNLKTLSRRTWCTVKRADRLQALLNIYALYHNQILAGVRMPRVDGRRAFK